MGVRVLHGAVGAGSANRLVGQPLGRLRRAVGSQSPYAAGGLASQGWLGRLGNMDDAAEPETPAPTEPEAPAPSDAEAPVGAQLAAPAPKRRGPKLTRRRLLGMMAGGMAAGAAWQVFVIDPPPGLATLELSKAALELIQKSWEGIDPAKVIDVHVHVMGLGKGGTGCFVHPDSTSFTSPVRWFKTRFYKGAAGIYDEERADALFVQRLVDLTTHQHPHGRFLLLA